MKKYITALAFIFVFSSTAYSQSEPPYGMSEVGAYSIFYENYRTGDYDMALQFGRWMLENKPENIQGVPRFNLSRQFERMINVYAEISKQQSDPSLRSAYLDSARTIYEDAFEHFTEDDIDMYRWHFNRGRFFQEHQSQIRGGMDLAYEDYLKAFELDPERLTNAGDGYYIQILLTNFVSQNQRDKALEMIDVVEPMAGAQLAASIDEIRDGLFTEPGERIEFLETRLEENPGDATLIREIASLYEDLGNREKSIEFAEKLYDMEPSFENIRTLIDYAKADAQNELALEYLREALDLTDDTDRTKNTLLEIAELEQNRGNLQTARTYARRALDVDSDWGQPYIRIASIYASAISQCTSGRQIDRDDRSVYWLVLDYLDRARSVDPTTSSRVQREYRTYEPVLPSSEDKFFRGWETGDQINVGSNISECYAWINETTTVR